MVGKDAIRTRPSSFIYGDETIPYERVLRSAKVNKILIKVHPDCRVVVHAPEVASDYDV